MKPSWCASLPVLSVPQSDQPKPVTLIKPYFENTNFLLSEMSRWRQWPESLRQHWSCIIVDDCSEWPASDVLVNGNLPLEMRLFRILKKARWNWLAARNIGAYESFERGAQDGWMLLTDMDHVVPPTTAESVVYGKHDPDVVYAFSRVEHTGETINPHSASFLMTRDLFWKVGGYDERYSGAYGSDGRYRRRLLATVPVHVLTDRLVRHEFQGDSSTTNYKRKRPEDDALLATIDAKVLARPSPTVLSFPYEEVPLKVAVA